MGRKNSAFTLIEILIVVVVIAMIAVLLIMALKGSFFRGRDARRKSDIDRIKIAAEEYEKDHNCYPPPELMYCNVPPLNGTGLVPYLNKIPCDPVTNASYFYFYEDSDPSCLRWFKIYTVLENIKDVSVEPGIGPGWSFNYVAASPNAPLEGGSSGSLVGSDSGFYGCLSGVCSPIGWNTSRPGPACDPNYQNSTCYGQCGPPAKECVRWQ